MTQLIEATYVCAICGKTVNCMGLSSTNSFGKPDLDMRSPRSAHNTLVLDTQTCPYCHYVSTDISRPVSERVKNYVLSPEYQKRATEDVSPNHIGIRHYRNLSDILLYDKNYSEGFYAIMKAAWEADDISDNDCAVKLRKKALSILENTPAKDHFTADTLTLITADLYRRTGAFDEVIDLCSDFHTENPFIADSLAYEIELAAKKDTAAHEVRYNAGETNDDTCSNSDTGKEDMTKTEEQPIESTGKIDIGTSPNTSRIFKSDFEWTQYYLSEIEYKKAEKYFTGDGIKQDYNTALMLFIMAAKSGNEKALYKLGLCYEQGVVVDLDEEKAIHWYRKAAELGCEDARSALRHLGRRYHGIGLQYFNGNGVEQDYQTAMNYFHKAAELGDEEARMALNSLERKHPESIVNNDGELK